MEHEISLKKISVEATEIMLFEVMNTFSLILSSVLFVSQEMLYEVWVLE